MRDMGHPTTPTTDSGVLRDLGCFFVLIAHLRGGEQNNMVLLGHIDMSPYHGLRPLPLPLATVYLYGKIWTGATMNVFNQCCIEFIFLWIQIALDCRLFSLKGR